MGGFYELFSNLRTGKCYATRANDLWLPGWGKFQSPENGEVLCNSMAPDDGGLKVSFQSPENGEVLCDLFYDRCDYRLFKQFQSPENGEVLCDSDDTPGNQGQLPKRFNPLRTGKCYATVVRVQPGHGFLQRFNPLRTGKCYATYRFMATRM